MPYLYVAAEGSGEESGYRQEDFVPFVSIVRDCAFHGGFGWAMNVQTAVFSKGLYIVNNVFFDYVAIGI